MDIATTLRGFWQGLRSGRVKDPGIARSVRPVDTPSVIGTPVDLAPDDPLFAYLHGTGSAIDIDQIDIDSLGVRALREAGVKLVVPLVSQGELVGLLNLGARLGQQEYSLDDRRLLTELATQVAPAVRVGELVWQQEREVQAREQIERELQVARLIQQTLLPHELPDIDGWELSAYYRPAREVGGDFYDFIELDGGRLGIVAADVTDKGVPAALVMATARSVLRGAAIELVSPAAVLGRANDLLHPDIPDKMFVTCLYAVLDPSNGSFLFANAGHNLPYWRSPDASDELTATGMPLGLMPDMSYEEREVTLSPGESLLLFSDGLVEAHNREREMFGFPRLRDLVAQHPGGAELIPYLLDQLEQFTGPAWEQEDDVTLVTLQCTGMAGNKPNSDHSRVKLTEFSVPSEQGNERPAVERLVEAVLEAGLDDARLDRLKTAVGEAIMNAMEHGNKFRPELPVSLEVYAAPDSIIVRVTDSGGGGAIGDVETPDLEAKLDGLQSPRGWGLYLMKSLVDDMTIEADETHHTIELVVSLAHDIENE